MVRASQFVQSVFGFRPITFELDKSKDKTTTALLVLIVLITRAERINTVCAVFFLSTLESGKLQLNECQIS